MSRGLFKLTSNKLSNSGASHPPPTPTAPKNKFAKLRRRANQVVKLQLN